MSSPMISLANQEAFTSGGVQAREAHATGNLIAESPFGGRLSGVFLTSTTSLLYHSVPGVIGAIIPQF
jgi:hypothetical protein